MHRPDRSDSLSGKQATSATHNHLFVKQKTYFYISFTLFYYHLMADAGNGCRFVSSQSNHA